MQNYTFRDNNLTDGRMDAGRTPEQAHTTTSVTSIYMYVLTGLIV